MKTRLSKRWMKGMFEWRKKQNGDIRSEQGMESKPINPKTKIRESTEQDRISAKMKST